MAEKIGDAGGHADTAAFIYARKALTHFADNSRHDDPWAAELYRRARDRGKRHARHGATTA
ncbi:hypothetical protein [Streptosporangium album]|uniref:hypothetical protein n=1 Tax=Streptosporangium album TaxID=47479 RepID=UPI0031E7679B